MATERERPKSQKCQSDSKIKSRHLTQKEPPTRLPGGANAVLHLKISFKINFGQITKVLTQTTKIETMNDNIERGVVLFD